MDDLEEKNENFYNRIDSIAASLGEESEVVIIACLHRDEDTHTVSVVSAYRGHHYAVQGLSRSITQSLEDRGLLRE